MCRAPWRASGSADASRPTTRASECPARPPRPRLRPAGPGGLSGGDSAERPPERGGAWAEPHRRGAGAHPRKGPERRCGRRPRPPEPRTVSRGMAGRRAAARRSARARRGAGPSGHFESAASGGRPYGGPLGPARGPGTYGGSRGSGSRRCPGGCGALAEMNAHCVGTLDCCSRAVFRNLRGRGRWSPEWGGWTSGSRAARAVPQVLKAPPLLAEASG